MSARVEHKHVWSVNGRNFDTEAEALNYARISDVQKAITPNSETHDREHSLFQVAWFLVNNAAARNRLVELLSTFGAA